MPFLSKKSHVQLQNTIQRTVAAAFHRLIQGAERYGSFLPSVMDPSTGIMLKQPPNPIPGQRQGDRAKWGCNLMHDLPLLKTTLDIGLAENNRQYVAFVHAYLKRFSSDCTQTPSGLFPWGEHAYWRLDRNEIGSSQADTGIDPTYPTIHDHLRAAPVWLWEILHEYNAQCVQRFAKGLDFHFKSGLPLEYSRHACLMAGDSSLTDHKGYERSGRPRRMLGPQDGANDFPRHSGFYAVDIAFAWNHSGDSKLKSMLAHVTDYWWDRIDGQGVIPLQSRGPDCPRLVSHSLSLAISLLEAANILQQGQHSDIPLSEQLTHRAEYYIDQCYWDGCNQDWEILRAGGGMAWGGEYGHQKCIANRYPCLYLGLYRLTGQQRLLDTALMLGRQLASAPIPISSELYLPAMDAAMILAAYCDLYELTYDKTWHDHAYHLGQHILDVYFQNTLPVGASGIHWYESQLGTSYLMHAMSRLGYLLQSPEHCPVHPDYTNR